MKDKTTVFLLIILIVHALVLAKLMFFPYPELFIYPYLTNNGLLPYHQIFDQHFPGLMFLPINLNNLGMTDEVSARWWLIGVVLLTQLLLFIICKSIFRSKEKALQVNLLYLIWQPFFEGWVLWIDSFIPLMLLPAFYFTYQSLASENEKFKFRWIFLTGFFLGLALLFKQVVGPLILATLIIILVYSPKLKSLLAFGAGLLPVPLAAVTYYWTLGIIKDVWFWTVVFNLTTFAEFGRKPPFFTGIVRLVGVYSPAILLPLIADRRLALTLAVYVLGGLLFAFARFDFVHLQPSLPFALIAIVAGVDIIGRYNWGRIAILGYLLVGIIWQVIFYRGHLQDKVWFFDDRTKQVAQRIKSLSDSKEHIFLFGPVLHLYQMSNTLPIGDIFAFQFPWFMMETEELFLKALINTPPRLVVRDRSVIIEGQSITSYASSLDRYIEEHYQVIDSEGQIEFMRPKKYE